MNGKFSALMRLSVISTALALAACGGGSDSAPVPAVSQSPNPGVVPTPPTGGAACTPVTHPLVGKSAALTTRSHGVSGQATIVDSCTIEITNFTYDGLGLSKVFVYGGLSGNYVTGFPVGPNLRGTVYTGQTLRVSLLPGQINLLNGISIWCSDANTSFGDTLFS
jgi:Electron transfer DM13